MTHGCLCCAKRFQSKRNTRNRFCDNRCQIDHQHKQYIERWLRGEETGSTGLTLTLSGHVRRYLRENFGTACSQCQWDIKHPTDGAQLTEIDHIDGDAANSSLQNLRILCPNCHSMTATFRARNKRSARSR